jgi:beta-galactosidase
MRNKIFYLLLACIFLTNSFSVAQDAFPRTIISLNSGWGYKPITKTQKDIPLTMVTLPHTWNARYIEGSTLYNREMMVYQRSLEITPEMAGKRLFLYFEGVNSSANIFVNNKTVGTHLGGYTAFCFEITDFVKPGANNLEVWVSNAYRTDVLPISGDFNVYGGIHRPCHLIVTEKNCISPVFYASPGVFIHQDDISAKMAKIVVETVLSLKDKTYSLMLKTSVTNAEGIVVASNETKVSDDNVKQPLQITNPTLWNGKKNPYLYNVTVELYENGILKDKVVQRTGFRYYSVDPEKGFFLNGKYLNLYGFNRHEDVEGKGSALTPEDYQKDMELINESGATAMRLAHYPHAEPMYDLSDENGIILWTEIPMCGPGGYSYAGYLHTDGFENNARQVLKELVYQKFNHPSICFWGIFNEILVNYDDPVPFIKELNALYKQLDPSRLTTFATCVDQKYYIGCSDLIAWNKYFGWYQSGVRQAGDFFDNAKINSNNQPIAVSEYGGGGSIYQHQWPLDEQNKPEGRCHPEESQTLCHEGNWSAYMGRPYLWAKLIWVFADFQSSIRKEGDKDGINDKGLISYDRKTKKDAFYFYKANWNSEPMIYITSRRFTERNSTDAEVKVYTNLKEATLYINGLKISKMKKDNINRIVWNNIKLVQGKNAIRVEAKSGGQTLTDSCEWNVKL